MSRVEGRRNLRILFACVGVVAAALAVLAACGAPESTRDAPAAPSAVARTPIRVVSLAPTATRFVQALGAESVLVGIDPASSGITRLGALPVVDLHGATRLAPDLVLLPALPPESDPAAGALRSMGTELLEFAPHDLEDVFALCRDLGERLVGAARASAFEHALARPLASIGGASFGQVRPRVLAVVGLEPLQLAGGHSFETDLIEIAGGRSVTHGGGEPRLVVGREGWDELAPDLVLVVTASEPTPAERRAALERLPGGYRVEFFAFAAERFWLGEPVETARRLRAVLEPLSRELAARR